MPTSNGKDYVIQPKEYVYHSVCYKKRDRYFYHYKQRKILYSLKKTINIRNDSFTLIHAHTLFTDGNIAYKLSKMYNIPYVVSVRNTDVNGFFKKRVFLRNKGIEILKDAEKIVFMSKVYQDEVLNKYVPGNLRKTIAGKSVIIPNGIDEYWLNNKFSPKDISERNTIKLIFAGRIDKNKNILTTIKSCELLISKGLDVKLTVVGRVEDTNEFNKIIKYNFVHYLPQQPKEKLIQLYRENDIFVMPSITETFGLVYAEAISQGVPVIYTKGQGFDEQFDEGVIGYRVNCYDYREIADKITSIMENYKKLSANCINHSNKFNWEVVSQDFEKIYKSSEKMMPLT
jgi:glycosyltransferase involved in cell wall biosynthesis